jgi:tetratricopeptide (TPR) repeat protein
MRSTFLLCVAILAAAVPAFSQSTLIKIGGVSEPPELTGDTKVVTKATPAEKQLMEIVGHMKDKDETKSVLPALNRLIAQYPDYSDAYFLRATSEACVLDSHDFGSIATDIEAAMSRSGVSIYNTTDYYSLLGKVEMEKAEFGQAMNDLEKGMTRDLTTASRMFNIAGTSPERTSNFCTWNLTDLDTLVARFPTDYRALIFRGLYYDFFTTFAEQFYEKAVQEFQRAALLKPTSPLPPYFIGQIHTKASFWTKKAWASDAGRDEASKSAVQAYTNAIQLDRNFLPAYEERASGYLNLKQYPQAIKDYDKILALDPKNETAYSDRGLAKLQSGQYQAAIFDFGEAIRLMSQGNSYLPNLYENRGDAYVDVGNYTNAIDDYSKAIKGQLANDTFLLSLKQIRALYPEYDSISDETLLRKIHQLFWPEFAYEVFVGQIEKNGTGAVSFLLSDRYEKRGDAYLKVGDYHRGVRDFARIFKGVPNMASSTERWRILGTSTGGDAYYLDVKTADFPLHGPVHLWIKSVGGKGTKVIEYKMDCSARRLSSAETVTYDSDGKVKNSSDIDSGWLGVIPDTIGEQFYDGACPNGG